MSDKFQPILWWFFLLCLHRIFGDLKLNTRYNRIKEMMHMENILVALVIAALLAASTLARDYAA